MGRPRTHPEGTTAADRDRASVAALVAAGGARRTFRFSPRAVESLAVIRKRCDDATDTAILERLIEEERARLHAISSKASG
jgi:hypothetical protein